MESLPPEIVLHCASFMPNETVCSFSAVSLAYLCTLKYEKSARKRSFLRKSIDRVLATRPERLKRRMCTLCGAHVACLIDLTSEPSVMRYGLPYCTMHFKVMRGVPFIHEVAF